MITSLAAQDSGVDSAESGFHSSAITTEKQSCHHMQTMTQQDSMPFLIKNEQITFYSAMDGRITAERILIP